MTLKKILKLIKSDLKRRVAYEGRQWGVGGLLAMLLSPPALAVVIWRMQSYFHHKNLYILCKFLSLANILLFHTEIDRTTRIEEGFLIHHADAVLIHGRTRIGSNCTFTYENTVTIGPRKGMDLENDWVVFEDEVTVGPGARFIGNLTIGHHSRVEANALVCRSAPPYSILAGIPARVIGTVSDGVTGEDDRAPPAPAAAKQQGEHSQ